MNTNDGATPDHGANRKKRRGAERQPAAPARPAMPPSELWRANASERVMARRFGAALVDEVVVFAAVFLVGRGELSTLALTIVAGLAIVPYAMVCESFRGQTLGKMLYGLRVVRKDGAQPGSESIIVRNLVRIVDNALYGIPGALAILASSGSRRIGDYAGGTTVVRATTRRASPPARAAADRTSAGEAAAGLVPWNYQPPMEPSEPEYVVIEGRRYRMWKPSAADSRRSDDAHGGGNILT